MPRSTKYDHGEIVRLASMGLTTAEIMAAVGCGSSTVCEVRREHGIASLEVRLHDWDKVVRMTLEGRSAPDIAAILGCTTRTVQRIRRKSGVARPAVAPMTEHEVARAEAMLADGASLSEVARTLGRGGLHKRFKGRGWSSADGAMARQMFAEVEAVRKHV